MILAYAGPAQASDGSSRFQLLSMKCEPEDGVTVETAPQSPPLDVDDPSTPGCNRWEINVVTSADVSFNEKRYELPLLDLNYGVGDNIQIKYEVPNQSSVEEGVSASGVGNSKLGIKYMYFENEESKTQMAIYPQLEFSTPSSGSRPNDFSTPGSIVTLPILITTKIGSITSGDVILTANLGYNLSSKTEVQSYLSAALGVGAPLSAKVSLMGELSTEQAFSKSADGVREQLVKLNLGSIVSVMKGLSIFGSIGESLASSDQKNHTYFLTGVRI